MFTFKEKETMNSNSKKICVITIINGIVILINGISFLFFTYLHFNEMKELGVTSSGNSFFYILEVGFMYLVGKTIIKVYLYSRGNQMDLNRLLTASILFTLLSILISLLVLYRINLNLKHNDLELTNNVQLSIWYSRIIIGMHLIYIVFYLVSTVFKTKKINL